MTNLNELTVKELQVIAKENGIAQSRTIEGKRQRLTKAELIAAIEAVQVTTITQSENEVAETSETVSNEVLTTFIQSVVSKSVQLKRLADKAKSVEKEVTLLSLSEIVPFATNKLKSITCLKELRQFKNKLLATFNDKQQTRKRTLKAKWAMQYNRLTMLFAQYERKLASSI